MEGKEKITAEELEEGKDNLPTETSTKTTPKGRGWHDRIKAKYPDKNFENDEDIEAALLGYLDDSDNYRTKMDEANSKMTEILKINPELAYVIQEMIENKVPFRVAIARHFSPEDFVAQEGDDDYEAWEGKNKERLNAIKEREELERLIAQNAEETAENLEKFFKSKGFDDKKAEEFADKVEDILMNAYRKKISPEFLEIMFKGLNYDKDIPSAKEEGVIEGKNAKIEAKLNNSKKKKEGDGIPALRSQNGKTSETSKEPGFWDDAFEKAAHRKI